MIAALLRVSTDEQDTARQRLAVERYARDNGLVVSRWYEDKESRDLSHSRPAFRRMLADVEAGAISLVLIEKFDRFGVSGKEEWFYYRYIFQRQGCKIVSVHPSEGDLTAKDDRVMLTTFFGADASEREQKSISSRVLGGKLRLAERGDWVGGPAPFGYDKVCLDPAGNILWRLERTGAKEYVQTFAGGHTVRHANSPGHGKGERLRLALNDGQAAVVRRIFRLWTTERVSLMGIALLLNKEGVRLHGKPFNGTTIKFILRNPRYLGAAVWNEKLGGRFHEVQGGRIVPIPQEKRDELYRSGKKTQRILRQNPEEGWVVCEDAHPAVIDRPTWELAQQKLAEGKDDKTRAPRKEAFWLKDLLWCAGCMKPMKAGICKGKAWYYCRTYDKADHEGLAHDCRCGRNNISHDEAEKIVLAWVREKGVELQGVSDTDVTSIYRLIADNKDQSELYLQKGWRTYLQRMSEHAPDAGFRRLIAAVLDRPTISVKDMRKVEEAKAQPFAERLNALNLEYEGVVRAKSKATSVKEEAVWQKEQARLEALIEAAESLAVPLKDRLVDAKERCARIVAQLGKAIQELEGGTPRQKAEALRRLIERVVLHFRKEPLEKMARIRQALEEMPEATSAEIAELLAGRGMHVESKTVATVRNRMRRNPSPAKRFRSVFNHADIQSSFQQSASRTR
jgi:DNA invertase Pin-like site-specific DNA recombinase